MTFFCLLNVMGIALHTCWKGKMPCTELISALGIPYGQQGADLADPNTACSMQETPVYALCPSLHCDFIFFFYQAKKDIFYHNSFKSNVYRPTQIRYYKLKNCTSGTILLELVFTSNNTS